MNINEYINSEHLWSIINVSNFPYETWQVWHNLLILLCHHQPQHFWILIILTQKIKWQQPAVLAWGRALTSKEAWLCACRSNPAPGMDQCDFTKIDGTEKRVYRIEFKLLGLRFLSYLVKICGGTSPCQRSWHRKKFWMKIHKKNINKIIW